jgi:uncharacterized membrane protein
MGMIVSGAFFTWLLFEASRLGEEKVAVFFSGVTSLVSIAAGFLAAFYFFVASRSTRFLEEIRTTQTFRVLIQTTRHALFASVLSIAACLLCMVYAPVLAWPIKDSDYLAMGAVLFLSYLVGTFWRCMVLFKRLTE